MDIGKDHKIATMTENIAPLPEAGVFNDNAPGLDDFTYAVLIPYPEWLVFVEVVGIADIKAEFGYADLMDCST